MNPQGEKFSERALGNNGQVFKHGPLYIRSGSISEVKIVEQSQTLAPLTKKASPPEGYFSFHQNDEWSCIHSQKEYGPRFQGIFLEKSCVENNRAGKPKVNEDFYPLIRRMLKSKSDRGFDFHSNGLATFMPLLMEWTEQMMERHEQVLQRADIYGLTAVSQFPYMFEPNVWRAFSELWGPLTNTLHHGGGEVSISLNDLKHIGGLPILGEPYEEFLPPNEQLADKKKYPSTVSELLRAHTDVCKSLKVSDVLWEDWLAHFYRGEKKYEAFGETSASCKLKRQDHQKDALRTSSKPLLPSFISEKGELAAFLALLLSRFLLPHGPKVISPGTFVMASFMAEGRKISLAPVVLGHIYNGLNKLATLSAPSNIIPSFGTHFLVGWLAEYFPSLYRSRHVDELPKEYPRLAYYAGVNGNSLSLHQARVVFRHPRYVIHRVVPFGDKVAFENVNGDKVSDANFERLLCIRPCVLPVRVGSEFILEPYYPNRFARQFGFDQAVPTNSLKFSNPQRSDKSLQVLARCYTLLFSKSTRVSYCIPRSDQIGICTWGFCSWWLTTSSPYLSQPINKINLILKKKDIEAPLKANIYRISTIRRAIRGLKGVVKVAEVHRLSSGSKDSAKPRGHSESFIDHGQQGIKFTSGKRSLRDQSPSDDINHKRRRYIRPSRSDESTVGENMGPGPKPTGHASIAVNIETPAQVNDIATFPEPEQTLPNLFSNPVTAYVRRTIIDGVKFIVEALASLESSPDHLSKRSEVLQNLEALQGIARAVKVTDEGLAWINTQVYEFLEDVEVVTRLEGEIDTTSLNNLSTNLSRYDIELDADKKELSQWLEESVAINDREKEILAKEAKLREMTIDLDADKEVLEADKELLDKEIDEIKKRIRLKEAQKQSLKEAESNNKTKLEDLKQKKAHLQIIVKDLTSLTPSG